jgi:SLT domain-containing protein
MHVVKLRAHPVFHAVLAAIGLVVVLAAVVPHWSELGHVLSGQDQVNGETGCLSGYEASSDGTSCHAAGWVRVAEAGAVFVLLNGAVLGWVAYKVQRERSRRASAMRQDWMVARAQARLNAKAAAAHAAATTWMPEPAPIPIVASPAEMVSQPPPSG